MKQKVAYILNYVPNYRNVFLEELSKYVDLTVISFNCKEANLKEPKFRNGYKYIELNQRRIFGISFQFKEYTCLNGDYDALIVGYDVHRPFRFLNLLRQKKIIFAGIIYGRNEHSLLSIFLRKVLLPNAKCVLVYSHLVRNKLIKEINTPVISFNNTSFSINDVNYLPFDFSNQKLNLIWVGRYQERKKIERLVEIARYDKRVNLRLIGPGMIDNIYLNKDDTNIELYDEQYGEELTNNYKWCHAVFNSGGAGLIVMNTARYGRPIFIDNDSFHGPEIELAIESKQLFIDFSDYNKVRELITKCIENREFLVSQANKLTEVFVNSYTIEHMTSRYLEAINLK